MRRQAPPPLLMNISTGARTSMPAPVGSRPFEGRVVLMDLLEGIRAAYRSALSCLPDARTWTREAAVSPSPRTPFASLEKPETHLQRLHGFSCLVRPGRGSGIFSHSADSTAPDPASRTICDEASDPPPPSGQDPKCLLEPQSRCGVLITMNQSDSVADSTDVPAHDPDRITEEMT